MKTDLDHLAHLVATRDFLLYQRNLELRSDYVSKLGQYELASFKLSCDAQRLRRKLSLAKEQMEQGETLNEAAIDAQLDEEFMAKDQLVEEMTANLFMAMGFQSMPRMSREDQSQMLYLYQQLAKAYYPALYPEDEGKAEQWEKARDCYQQWDLDALIEMEEEAEQNGVLEQAQKQVDPQQLEQLQNELEKEVNAILQQFPFNLKELLEDEEQLEKHREEIQRTAEKADQELQDLQKEVTLLFDPVSQMLN